MKIKKSHNFGVEEATERAAALTAYWDKRYGTKTVWSGPTARISGKVRGIKFDGTFTVGAGTLDADVKVGFLAEKMGGKQYVEGKLDDYFNPSTPLETLKAKV